MLSRKLDSSGAKPVALDAWKKLAAIPIAALLKTHGFRKSGLNFSASRPGLTLLVSLQGSTGSTQAAMKITCNVGIHLHLLATGLGVGIWDAHWCERIGAFLTEPQDFWWQCTDDDQARAAGWEIAGLLELRALPEMERLSTPAALASLWSSGRAPGLTEHQRLGYLARLAAGAGPTV